MRPDLTGPGPTRPRDARAFTLVELIVVIVVIGVLAALAVPRFTATLQESRDKTSAAELAATSRAALALATLQGNDPPTAADYAEVLHDSEAAETIAIVGHPAWTTVVDGEETAPKVVPGEGELYVFSQGTRGYAISALTHRGAPSAAVSVVEGTTVAADVTDIGSATDWDALADAILAGSAPSTSGSGTSSESASAYAQSVLADGPLAYFRFDDGDMTAWDSSGNALHGNYWSKTLVPSLVPTDNGSAFTGSFNAPVPLTDVNTLSVEWWTRSTVEPTTMYWGAGPRHTNFVNGWSVDVRGVSDGAGGIAPDTATIGVRIDTSAAGNQVRAIPRSAVNVHDGQPHHIVLILDNGALEWWVDGQSVATTSYLPGDGFTQPNTFASYASNGIQGDDVALHVGRLAPERIVAHYEAGVGQ